MESKHLRFLPPPTNSQFLGYLLHILYSCTSLPVNFLKNKTKQKHATHTVLPLTFLLFIYNISSCHPCLFRIIVRLYGNRSNDLLDVFRLLRVADRALATISAHVPLVLLQVHAWRRWPEGKSSPPSVALLLLHLDEAVSCCDLHFCPPPRRLGPHISSSALRPVLCGSQSRVLPQGSPFCTKKSFSSSTNPVPPSAQLPACHTPDVCVACPRGPSAGEQVPRSGAESWSHSLTTGRVVSILVLRGG